MVLREKVSRQCVSQTCGHDLLILLVEQGGKAKPLKAPKKEKKELDEDDLAHKEKLKAGMGLSDHPRSLTLQIALARQADRLI